MATKNNNRNIRISDQMLQLIEKQSGNNFTEKWEMLVIRCNWELPEKEKQLKELEEQIRKKKQMMAEASSRYARMINQLSVLEQRMYALDSAIGRALDEWPDDEM